LQLLARLGSRPSVKGLEPAVFGNGPQCRDAIEIYGEEGTGKTEFMVHLIVRCILPETWNNITLGGHGGGVVFIDTDHKFSILRLAGLMERHVTKAAANNQGNSTDDVPVDSEAIENLITQCLEKLYVVKCTSSTQLVFTIHNLESLICSDPDISVIMIDSISAFYWIDRALGGESVAIQEANMRLATEALLRLVNTYSLVLFASKSAVFKKKGSDLAEDNEQNGEKSKRVKSLLNEDFDLFHAEFMCKAWQRFVSHRLVLAKNGETGNQEASFVVGGDCVKGNRQFIVSQSGLQVL
ncbi:XRCC2-like protein, partial [Mya arenaria]